MNKKNSSSLETKAFGSFETSVKQSDTHQKRGPFMEVAAVGQTAESISPAHARTTQIKSECSPDTSSWSSAGSKNAQRPHRYQSVPETRSRILSQTQSCNENEIFTARVSFNMLEIHITIYVRLDITIRTDEEHHNMQVTWPTFC